MGPKGFCACPDSELLDGEQALESKFYDSLFSPLSLTRYFNSVVSNIVFSITMDHKTLSYYCFLLQSHEILMMLSVVNETLINNQKNKYWQILSLCSFVKLEEQCPLGIL